ncbi:MAG TPA: FAD/NAD(P)-binding protein [Smithella sp.]|nr:FAD/NAD(P)-binding protein [Smithella sp.]HRS98194.1 FAD/NAD(P)-binding protein [Smithella sp.]
MGNHCTNIYQLRPVSVVRVLPQIRDHRLFQLRLEDGTTWETFGHQPGQFIEVSIFGKGEAPISISSPPTRPDTLEICVRKAGKVTGALFEMGKGSTLHIRGPYGRGFPVEHLKGKKLLLIAGGLGLAPLRSLLLYALDHRKEFDDIILMYGTNNPDNVLFKYELLSFFDRDDIQYLYSVDRDDEVIWKQYVGLVTGLFDRTNLYPGETYAVMCGPPIMYRFVLQKLLQLGFPREHIYMSLERMMKCGVGKCGHCAFGDKYCCMDGPVFSYPEIENMKEAI